MKKIFMSLICFSSMLLQAQISTGVPGAVNVNSTGNDISALVKEIKALTGSITSIAESIKSLTEKVKMLQETRDAYTKDLNKINQELGLLGKKENRSEAEIARLAQLNLQLAQLNSRIEQLNKDIENTQRQIEQQIAEMNALEESIDKLEQKMVAAANKEKSEGKGTQKTDSIIKAERISFYIKATKLLQVNPSIRSGLTAAELKTLTAFENKYKSDNAFKTGVDKEKQVAFAVTAAADSKESTEAARDRKKAQMDALKKYLEILASMNPQI